MHHQVNILSDNNYMQRCLELAKKAVGYVAPNPMVGAVLVYKNRILAEGWHKHYGEAHAEVNCLAAVRPEDQAYIQQATLYVSLEPCAHHGKTPPCADLIIRHQIPRVVIGCIDPFAKVAGKGVEKLQKAGIEVITEGPWTKDCIQLNRRFFTFHQKKRPFITLKWAATVDHFIAPVQQSGSTERLKISGAITDKLVHKWRSEAAAILVGKNTALKDDPALTNRLYFGATPIKMALDPHLEIPPSARIFENTTSAATPVVIFNYIKSEKILQSPLRPATQQSISAAVADVQPNRGLPIHYVQLDPVKPVPLQIAAYCFEHHIQSVLIEGGRRLLQSFIDQNLWDECRIITNTQLKIGAGLSEPFLGKKEFQREIPLGQDKISYFAADFE
jgi:diaminohydroxyphosphoribosylaminopyrimidine deaminase/5-amino-6-(5-phosphoribosylamino)uracil reductase